jgi:hypothetical protein
VFIGEDIIETLVHVNEAIYDILIGNGFRSDPSLIRTFACRVSTSPDPLYNMRGRDKADVQGLSSQR